MTQKPSSSGSTQEPSANDSLMPIVNAVRDGDRQALDHLLVKLLPDVNCYVRLNCSRTMRQCESLSDLTQSVCREMLEDVLQFEGTTDSAFRTWLFTIAENKVRARHRFWNAARRDRKREIRRADSPTTEAGNLLAGYASLCSPSQSAVSREEVDRIESAFDRLPPDYQEIIRLACFCGLPYSEIAGRFDRSEGAIRTLLSRARSRLALMIARDGDD